MNAFWFFFLLLLSLGLFAALAPHIYFALGVPLARLLYPFGLELLGYGLVLLLLIASLIILVLFILRRFGSFFD